MVWNKRHDGADLDEKFHKLREDPFDESPKMVELPEDYVRALEARAVLNSAWLYASRELTDGVLAREVLPMIAANAQVYQHRIAQAIDAAVRVKLLRKRTKRSGGGWEVPNFLKYNPSKDQVSRRKAAKSRLAWLHYGSGRKVRDFIQERDGFRCRYCYIEMKPGDQRSLFRPTHDHVRPHDPDCDRDPRFIVQACAFHNSQKLDRTPEEAGLVLLPPWTEADEGMKVQGKEQQEIAMVVAATLQQHDPDPETIIAAFNEVQNTRSQPDRGPEFSAATEPHFDRGSTVDSGRVGSERSNGSDAGSAPPHTDSDFTGED